MLLLEIFVLLLSFCSMPKAVSSVEVEFKAEYYSNVTLVCDDTLLGLPYTTYKKYWILPNGTALQWSYEPGNYSSRFSVGESPGFNLTIANVDEDDFGWYYCVILWDNYIYLVHTIKVGLNVNGALYKELLDQYRKSAIIGLIAGAVTATVLGLFCLLYWCRYSEVNTENDEKREKLNKSDAKNDTSDENSKTDTVYGEEKEAIYELDKAVKGYDDDATVAGDGEVAIGLKVARDDSLEEDGMPLNLFEPIPAAVEITQPKVARYSEDDGDCNNIVPPPPPPPLNDSFEETDVHMHGYLNNAFDLEKDEYPQDSDSETDRKYLHQEDTLSHDKGQYADVKF
ncbi:uncharacterized protein LOC123558898 [Mercenaria mercenaria]|uniref:uncharacterized protein LOC123558898 n=1 Tax=Mercenaria mercenaria TaxID=6596 RepID=UPI00234E5A1B|nr:uncharacterized protein LOC123558898 [Mercenaria mercenaria]